MGDGAVKREEYHRAIDRMIEQGEPGSIHISPDFQCDVSGGFPVSLCVSWEDGKAWLTPNEHLLCNLPLELTEETMWQACADFGIRDCEDSMDFNCILEELGEDAVDSAWIPEEEEEGVTMDW